MHHSTVLVEGTITFIYHILSILSNIYSALQLDLPNEVVRNYNSFISSFINKKLSDFPTAGKRTSHACIYTNVDEEMGAALI